MAMCFSRISRLVPLLCCVFLASTTSASKTTRRFFGLPGTGERVNYSNASENNKTLIIRHNLPGRIIFQESNEFWIELLTTTPEEQNNSHVRISYTTIENNSTILLQVYEPKIAQPADTSETEKLLVIIFSGVGSFVVLGLVVSVLCYFCYWKKRQQRKENTNELVEENVTAAKRRCSGASLGSVAPSPSGTQLLIVAVCACALHAQLQTTNVEVTVYFPKGFLRSDSRVFLKSENNNEVRVISNNTRLIFNVFDVPNAGLVSENRCRDTNITCANGACDPLVGKCICPRKMRAIRHKGGDGEDVRCVLRCDQKCQSGFFELVSCNHTHQAVCKKCRPQCSFKEFESVPCTGKTDRNCSDISKLPHIKVSPNIVYEDMLKVKADPPLRQTINNASSLSYVWLNRSRSGLAIKLQVLAVYFSTTFREVKHDFNDNSRLPNDGTSQTILRDLCRFPVPDYYRISLQESAENVRIVKGQPNTPCPRYDGMFPTPPVRGNILSCDGAENPVVRLFGVKGRTDEFWKEESSKACHNLKQECDKCRSECTVLSRENPICNLTKNNALHDSKQDYGEHFTYCFDCCFQENCTCPNCACSRYQSSCIDSQLTCVGVKQFTIPITPVFPNKGFFKCHVELVRGPVFELEKSLWKDGKLLGKIEKSNKNYSNEDGRGTTSYDFGYMVLRQPSELRSDQTKVMMISGNAAESNFDVGWYKTEQELESLNTNGKLYIQPIEPFKINTNTWPREKCQTLDTENFVVTSSTASISTIEQLTQASAQVAYEDSDRVYKVYNNSGSPEVHVEVPSGRSILRHAFPGTAILNDKSFTGQLLRKRTFWTIRLTGQASTCPGFFMVRLTDQDRPDVYVYHYDIAITNEDCSFKVEFHLPSGGDTNMIDKQFIVRLTDSRKTMKIILVSPRRIPEFETPDFDEDFDLQQLEVLIPFGGAAGGMFIVLMAILIYGYKTRPKDSYQRDRDNELHFRHILFVVWFVGMRLVKSFLLTLTALFVILAAIHHRNVKTLEKYKTFHERQTKLEQEFIKQMDNHKAQEINRQWSLLGEGKVVCEQKLKDLNTFLEKHFKEMKERQQEEMKRKSIILAAEDRIKKQFNASRDKFEKERKRLNERLEAYSTEINSRISQVQTKIEGSFWLKAAKGLYGFLDGLARAFGESGIKKPFIDWVGLSASFPSVNVNLPSFDDIFQDFDKEAPIASISVQDMDVSTWQRKNPINTKINIQHISAPNLNISRKLSIERAEELLALEWIVQLYRSGVFTAVVIALDILWFVYRHSRTYQLAIVLIHGFPKVYKMEEVQKKEEKKDEKKKVKEEKSRRKEQEKARKENEKGTTLGGLGMKNEDLEESPSASRSADSAPQLPMDQDSLHIERIDNSDEKITSDELKTTRATRLGLKGLDNLNTVLVKFLVKLKELNYQINNTNLVPMCVLSVIAILSVYVVIVTAKHSTSVETLDVVGYFDLKMAPLLTMRKIVNTRITSNAFLVNDVHIPYYENRVNARISFYQKKAKMYQAYQCSKADLHNEEYCSWAQEPGENWEGVGPYNQQFLSNLTQFECNLEAVIPQRFTKFDRIRYKEVHKKAIAPYVAALRGLILDTFYMFLILIGIFILFKILGIAMFLLLKKFDLVRQVKHYQTNRDLKKDFTLPHCIKYPSSERVIRRVGPLQMSDDMTATFGPSIHKGKRIQWFQ